MFKQFILVIGLSLFSAQSGWPQASDATAQETPDRKRLRANTELLLENSLAQVPQLQRLDNRIYAQSWLAELLWPKDEARARALMNEAIGLFMEFAQQPAAANPRNHRVQQSVQAARGQIFNTLLQHDAAQALQFLRQLRALDAARPSRNQWQEREMEMNLAVKVAATDPQAALKTAKDSLASDEVSWSLMNVFQALQQKDPAAAAELFAAALEKLRSTDRSANSSGQQYVSFMANFLNVLKGSLPALEEPKPKPKSNHEKPSLTEEQLQSQQTALRQFRELMEWFIGEALKINEGDLLDEQSGQMKQQVLSTVTNFIEDIEKRLPHRLAAVRVKVNQLGKATRSHNVYQRYQKQLETQTPEELLALAKQAPKQEREFLVSNALNKAVHANVNEAQVRKLIQENLSDPERQQQMLNQLSFQLANKAFAANRMEEARGHLARLTEPATRFQILTNWAQQKFSANDRPAALSFLQEAQALIGERFHTNQQVQQQLVLAALYVEVEPARALKICEAALERLSVINQARWTLSLYEQESADELESEMPLNEMQSHLIPHSLTQTLAKLVSHQQLEDVQRLLARWPAQELRIYTQLAVVRDLQQLFPDSIKAAGGVVQLRRPSKR